MTSFLNLAAAAVLPALCAGPPALPGVVPVDRPGHTRQAAAALDPPEIRGL